MEAHIARREGGFEFPEDLGPEDYKNERLGEWIEAEFDEQVDLKYASDSGTLRSNLKKDFARWTADMVEAEYLTESIEELMREMYEHIDAQHEHLESAEG